MVYMGPEKVRIAVPGFQEITNADDLRNAVRGKSKKQITREVIEAGLDQVLQLVFLGFMASFKPERARGVSAVIEYRLRALDRRISYQVKVANDECSVQENGADRPDLVLYLSVAEFLRLITRQFNLLWALYMLWFKTRGDRKLAARMSRWF